jgi:hypothetical protein
MTLPIARESAARAIRWFHLAFGAWLIVSAFLLRHTEQSSANTWAMGALMAVIAVASFFAWHWLLRVNAVFAGWLLVSTMIVPYAGGLTQAHNAIVAVALLVLALAPVRFFERRPEERGEAPAQGKVTA